MRTRRLFPLLTLTLLTACALDVPSGGALGAGGQPSSEPASTTTKQAKLVGVDGGELSVAGATIMIPPGALSGDVEIQLERIDSGSVAFPPSGVSPTSSAIAFTPHGLSFNQPVEIELAYSGSDVRNLRVGRLENPSDADWEALPNANGFENGKANFSVNGFSIYAIFDDPADAFEGGPPVGMGSGGTTSVGGGASTGGTTSVGGSTGAGGVTSSGGASQGGAGGAGGAGSGGATATGGVSAGGAGGAGP